MPREIILVSVGQCGNQVANKFWELALKEHASQNPNAVFTLDMSALFRNVEYRQGNPVEVPLGDGTARIRELRARAVLVDMEEGVVREIMKGQLRELFDEQQLFTIEPSGSGNNWACGFGCYGPKYHEELLERVRRQAEPCESLQSFFITQSLGGGTGSGTGTYVVQMLADEFPDQYRFVTSVFPSVDDDVVTSPYNSMLALRVLKEEASAVLPVANDSLQSLATLMDATKRKMPRGVGSASASLKKSSIWDKVNGIIASLLTDLTSSMRFKGSLNIDLNEITTNLVPYPSLHFLLSSLSPLNPISDLLASHPGMTFKKEIPPRGFDQLFTDVINPHHQTIGYAPKANRCLASCFMVRGEANVSDVTRNVSRVAEQLKMLPWSEVSC